MSYSDPETERRSKLIRTAGFIALYGNLFLAVMKIVLGKLSGSLAVFGDGIDSSTDVGIAFMTLIISKVIERPGDIDHPWGHGRAETTATMTLAFIIFFAGAQLALSSIRQLITGEHPEDVNLLAILAALISIAGKTALAWSQYKFSSKCNSEMLLANAMNMRNDIIMSAGVLGGLLAAKLFRQPALDPVIALLVSIWVIKNAVLLIKQINLELMDGNTDKGLYKKLFDAAMRVPGVSNPHRARIRKIASRWDIDLDIEVNASMPVHAAHEIAEQVEKSIRAAIPDVYDIMVHVEPAGHSGHHEPEQYGVNEQDITSGA
jgi:cation diffusion facilitator family transporter